MATLSGNRRGSGDVAQRYFIQTTPFLACFAVVLGMFLSGCATTTQYVPVTSPEPPQIARPVLETQKLKPGASPAEVIRSHRVDIVNLIGYALQLETLLEAYRKPNSTKQPPKEQP